MKWNFNVYQADRTQVFHLIWWTEQHCQTTGVFSKWKVPIASSSSPLPCFIQSKVQKYFFCLVTQKEETRGKKINITLSMTLASKNLKGRISGEFLKDCFFVLFFGVFSTFFFFFFFPKSLTSNLVLFLFIFIFNFRKQTCFSQGNN